MSAEKGPWEREPQIDDDMPPLIHDGGDRYLDLGLCPYLFRWYSLPGHDPHAVCAYGCRDEPECMTCEPEDFWPSWAPLVALWWAADCFGVGPVSQSVTRYLS